MDMKEEEEEGDLTATPRKWDGRWDGQRAGDGRGMGEKWGVWKLGLSGCPDWV
jgi:hypothetical protein